MSPLLRKSTLWTMRPPMSVTLDTNCEDQPDVFAYQTGSGAARLPSVAATVSPNSNLLSFSLSVLCHILIVDIYNISLLLQWGISVLILVSQLVLQEQGTCLELMTKSHTAAVATCFWWDPTKESVWRMASGLALNQHATVRPDT